MGSLGRLAEGAVLSEELEVLKLADCGKHGLNIGSLYPIAKNYRLELFPNPPYLASIAAGLSGLKIQGDRICWALATPCRTSRSWA
jgi:hypothetical protein